MTVAGQLFREITTVCVWGEGWRGWRKALNSGLQGELLKADLGGGHSTNGYCVGVRMARQSYWPVLVHSSWTILHHSKLQLGNGDQASKRHYPLGKKTLFPHPHSQVQCYLTITHKEYPQMPPLEDKHGRGGEKKEHFLSSKRLFPNCTIQKILLD